MTNTNNDFENVMDSVNNVPMPPLPVDGDRADLEAYLEEKRKALKECTPEGANEIIMAISNNKYRKAVIAFNGADGNTAMSKVMDWRNTGLETTSAGLYTLMSGAKMFLDNAKAGKVSPDIKNVILASNTSSAITFAGKALYDGEVKFSSKSTVGQKERKAIVQYATYIMGIVGELKDMGYNVSLESMERNTIMSNGKISSDLFALRDAVAVFSDVEIKDNMYRMASVDMAINGDTKKFNMFTRFRKDAGAKGIIKSYKDKKIKNATTEFYVESPYREALWNIYAEAKAMVMH